MSNINFNNTIQVRTRNYLSFAYGYDYPIKIVNQGNNTFRLTPTHSNAEVIVDRCRIAETILIKFYDSSGNEKGTGKLAGDSYFNTPDYAMQSFPTLNIGDSINFDVHVNENIKIEGNILNVTDGHNYANGLANRGAHQRFILTSNGLSVQWF